MTPVLLILLLASAIQLAAVILALRFIIATHTRRALALLFLTLLLMMFRKLILILGITFPEMPLLSSEVMTELIALAISILLLISLLGIRRLFLARQQAEQEKHGLLQAIIDGKIEAVFAKNLRGRYVMINAVGADMLGKPREEILGKTDAEIFSPAAARAIMDRDRTIMATGIAQTFEETFFASGHTRICLTTRAAFRDEKGTIIGLIGIARDITEQKRALQALEESEKKFRDLVQSIEAIVWEGDPKTFQFSFVSQQAEKILGYPVDQWLREPNFWGEHLHPDDRKWAREFCARATNRLQNHEFDYRMIAADGNVVWLRDLVTVEAIDNQPVRLRGVMFDITQRKQAQHELQEALSLLTATLNSTTDGILVVNSAGKIVSHNHKFMEMWRIPESILASRDDDQALEFVLDQLIEPEKFLSKVRELYRQPEAESFDVLEFKDGRIFERYSQPQRIDGVSVGRVWSFRDVTERRRTEKALLQSQKLESLGVLAGGIAHDFNNLLVGILGNAGLALMELSTDSPARETVQQIELAGQRAAELIKQMLAYSGKGRFVIQRLSLNAVIEEMAHLLQVSIGKTVAVKYNFAPDLPAVEADATQIRQVVMNLVVNASEAIGNKSGVITISTGVMHADRAYLTEAYTSVDFPEGDYVYLEVADTGCGMDAETMAKIFDPFFTTKFTGRGLGLAAALGIVRGHKGAIKISSAPGRGTTFIVLFPGLDRAISPAAESHEPKPAPGNSGTVLVIDDDDMVRTVTGRVLKQLGFTALLAATGSDGVDLFRKHAPTIVCVLLDWTMPPPSGEEVFNEIRRAKNDAAIILMSGYTEQEAMNRFAGKGLAGFLQKPYTPKDLRDKLMAALGAVSHKGAKVRIKF